MKWYSQLLGDFGIYLKDYKDYHKKSGRNYMKPVWARFANEELYLMAWQKTKEIYFWRFVLAVGIVPWLAWPFIWFRLDFSWESASYVHHSLAFIELIILFMVSKSYNWQNGFWIGVYADDFEYHPSPYILSQRSNEASVMTNNSTESYEVEFEKVQRTKRLMYLLVPACLGSLIICRSFEASTEHSWLVWPFLGFAVWYLGQALGEEVGLKKGFSVRKSLETTPSEASLMTLNRNDPHAPLF